VLSRTSIRAAFALILVLGLGLASGGPCAAQAAKAESSAAMQQRYDELQRQFDSTTDPARLEVLDREIETLSEELTKRNQAQLRANSDEFAALMVQMHDALKLQSPTRWQRLKAKLRGWWGGDRW
jgi:uncharacterized protein HemX